MVSFRRFTLLGGVLSLVFANFTMAEEWVYSPQTVDPQTVETCAPPPAASAATAARKTRCWGSFFQPTLVGRISLAR